MTNQKQENCNLTDFENNIEDTRLKIIKIIRDRISELIRYSKMFYIAFSEYPATKDNNIIIIPDDYGESVCLQKAIDSSRKTLSLLEMSIENHVNINRITEYLKYLETVQSVDCNISNIQKEYKERLDTIFKTAEKICRVN